jgi:hypothetical protein
VSASTKPELTQQRIWKAVITIVVGLEYRPAPGINTGVNIDFKDLTRPV